LPCLERHVFYVLSSQIFGNPLELAPHIFSSVLSFCNEWLEKRRVL
jgi:hypothetical protein